MTRVVWSTYQVRPQLQIDSGNNELPIDSYLTKLSDLPITAAMTSDAFYLMHNGGGIPGDAFHKELGVPTGYIDGSVRFISGKNDIILAAASNNSSASYWRDTDGDGNPDPPSLWGILDAQGEY